MTATFQFPERSTTLKVTIEQSFSAIDFNFQCNSVDERDEMAIKAMIAISNNFFNN
ncbi:MAG: hypothetical protein IJG09_04450 [Methanobrevibacter sp.]|nr:hypothetical protein [Methanobrevibacter sp.]